MARWFKICGAAGSGNKAAAREKRIAAERKIKHVGARRKSCGGSGRISPYAGERRAFFIEKAARRRTEALEEEKQIGK